MVYRIGSEKHLKLIREARALWIRGIIEVSDDDKGLLETHLGHFGLYEGVEVPLDLPMVNEIKIPSQEEVDKFFSITQNEIHYLNSKPVMGQEGDRVRSEIEPWDEYDLSNWNALVRKAKAQGKINEGFYSSPSDLEGSGLNVIPKDQIHANKLQDALENSGLYGEWNAREGYFFFPEEEDGYNYLEEKIQELMDDYNIQGYIEGVFEESLNENNLLKQTNLSSEEYQKAEKLKGFNADDYTFSSDNNLYVKKSSLDEAMVDYDFSKEELIRVIKQLKSGASTEVGMIKAFEKALGRELTDDEIRGFKIDPSKVGRASLEERINTILEAKKKNHFLKKKKKKKKKKK